MHYKLRAIISLELDYFFGNMPTSEDALRAFIPEEPPKLTPQHATDNIIHP